MSPTAAAPIEIKMRFVAGNHFAVFTQASMGCVHGEVMDGVSFLHLPQGSWAICRTEGGKREGLTGPTG